MHIPRKTLRPEDHGMKDGQMATDAVVSLWEAERTDNGSESAKRKILKAKERIKRVIELDKRSFSY